MLGSARTEPSRPEPTRPQPAAGTVAPDGDGRVTDCGGTSLQVIFRGAQVVAETSQQARAAEGACQRAAWISQVSGVVLFSC